MRTQSVILNLIPSGVNPVVHLSQYDQEDDGALLFNIYDGNVLADLTGCTATIEGTKPDGTFYMYPCTVYSTYLTSAVNFQMTSIAGSYPAEVRINRGAENVGTINLTMMVEPAGVGRVDVSDTEIPSLLDDIETSVDEAEYWAHVAEHAVTGVASWNGRTGAVVPAAGDYDASQVDYDNSNSGLTATTEQDAIDELAVTSDCMLNELGAKNLCPNTATSQTVNGVTFTVNSDGTIRAVGTATSAILFEISIKPTLEDGTYILSGCPQGGSPDTYYLHYTNAVDTAFSDYGEGVEFTPFDYAQSPNAKVRLCIKPAAGAVDLLFKPMIRPASIVDSTYVPYAMTNRELTNNPNTISSNVAGVGWIKIGRIVTVFFNQLVINGTTPTGIPVQVCNSVVSLRDESVGGVAHIVLTSTGSFMPSAGQTGYVAGHKYSGMFSYISQK